MKHKQQFRQGDVLIERVQEIPSTAKAVDKTKHSRIILAHGEMTGHHHSLDIDSADWWKTKREDESFIKVKVATEVVHQEHEPIALKRGTYRATRQREYSPEAIRRVAD